jgi:hypothetical protein
MSAAETTTAPLALRALLHKHNNYALPDENNIYTLTKGGRQESNLEATITEDGDPHQHPPTRAATATIILLAVN